MDSLLKLCKSFVIFVAQQELEGGAVDIVSNKNKERMEYVQKINCLYQPIEVCPQEQEADDIPFGYIYLGANFSQKYVPCKPK